VKTHWIIFAEEYLIIWNPTEAARNTGYSKRSIHNQAYRLMRNDEILCYINHRVEDLIMDSNEILFHIARIAKGIQSNCFTELGISLEEIIKNNDFDLIKYLIFHDKGIISVEFYSRLDALGLLLSAQMGGKNYGKR
jgi:hypothetical protein